MKKFITSASNLLLGLVVVAGFAACGESSDNPNKQDTKIVDNVVVTVTRDMVITTNVAADIAVNGIIKKGVTELNLSELPKKGTIVVSAAGYVTKSFDYDFEEGKIISLDIDLEKAGESVAQAAAEATGAEAVQGNTVEAEVAGGGAITVSMDVATAAAGGEDFITNRAEVGDAPYSVTIVTPLPSETDIEEVKTEAEAGVGSEESEIETPALQLLCEPSGAVFATPLTLTVTIPEAEDLDLAVVYNDSDEEAKVSVEGDKVSIDVDHFSIWDIILRANLVSKEETVEENTITGPSSVGEFTAAIPFGFETTEDNTLVLKWIKSLFGAKKKMIEKTFDFTAVRNGTARLLLKRLVTTYTFKSGKKEFKVKYYGELGTNLSMEIPADEDVKTHGGATND